MNSILQWVLAYADCVGPSGICKAIDAADVVPASVYGGGPGPPTVRSHSRPRYDNFQLNLRSTVGKFVVVALSPPNAFLRSRGSAWDLVGRTRSPSSGRSSGNTSEFVPHKWMRSGLELRQSSSLLQPGNLLFASTFLLKSSQVYITHANIIFGEFSLSRGI